METFEQVWESSRHNVWTGAYPTAILVGAMLIVALSFGRNIGARRLKILATIFVFSFIAMAFSAQEIDTKWRTRHEWTRNHADTLTENQQRISNADGANLVFGPILYGFQAFIMFVSVAMITTLVRLAKTRQRK